MAGLSDAIKIDGLKQLVRNLKAVDRDLPKALRVAFNDAAEIIVEDARKGVPRRSGRARASVKARSTQTRARVVGGGRRAPYYPWLDFGGRVGRRNSVRRPTVTDGRYLYPAYFAARDSGRIQEALQESVVDVVRRAGLEVD